MTKDRRLGRGLAALLGTPLEEDGIVDSAATPATAALQSPAPKQKTTAPRPALAAKTSTAKKSPASSKRPADKPVTGSVPLARQASEAPAVQPTGTSLELSVYEIDNNPFQPRRVFNEEEIASLAESIREHQQLQPVLVRKVGGRYQLISGERRLRATIHAGLKTIRAEVREADDRLVAELAIVENLQRKDLDPIEKALSFRRYIDQHNCTQDDLAKRLKIDRSTIANLMRLMELPEKIQTWVQSGDVTAGHARALLPLGEEHQQLEFAAQIKDEKWSVRETERRVTEQLAIEDGELPGGPKPSNGRKRPNPQLAALEQQLRLSLGTKTDVKQSASGRGKIVISFANADEFDRIIGLVCPQAERRAA